MSSNEAPWSNQKDTPIENKKREEQNMKRTWCVVDGVFEKDDSLWWLNRNLTEKTESNKTPMIVALKNGGISRVIDVKGGGLTNINNRQGIF